MAGGRITTSAITGGFKTKLGASHRDTIVGMASLAETWKTGGKKAEAMRVFKEQASEIPGRKNMNIMYVIRLHLLNCSKTDNDNCR
jgi:hypothetical protein